MFISFIEIFILRKWRRSDIQNKISIQLRTGFNKLQKQFQLYTKIKLRMPKEPNTNVKQPKANIFPGLIYES